MKAHEIYPKTFRDWTKEKSIEQIFQLVDGGCDVPEVSGGNGGSGLAAVNAWSLNDEEQAAFRKELEGCEFSNDPEIFEDFEDFVALEDFSGCVQFDYPNGLRVQFLLW